MVTRVLEHDIRHFFRYKWWLAGLIAINLADIFVMALVFSNIIRALDYFKFVVPGVAVAALFVSAFAIGREVNMEIRRGYLHYLLSLPTPRRDLVVGRIASGAVRGMLYSSPFVAFAAAVNWPVSPSDFAAALLALLAISVAFSSLSVALAASVRSFDKFVMIRATLNFLFMFASTVFYPIQALEAAFGASSLLALFARNNPVSHGAELLRSALAGSAGGQVWRLAPLSALTALLTLAGALIYGRALVK